MSTTATCLTALTAVRLVLLLWVVGRAVTAAGNRIPQRGPVVPLHGRTAGRRPDHHHHRLRRRTPGQPGHPGRPADWSVPHHGPHMLPDQGLALARREDPLRPYLSYDGAIMLADLVLGGNAPREPSTTPPGPARLAKSHAPLDDLANYSAHHSRSLAGLTSATTPANTHLRPGSGLPVCDRARLRSSTWSRPSCL
jgi:hypothetical protein